MQDLYFQDIETIKAKQWQLLKKQLEYISERSPFYKNLFKEKLIDIKSIENAESFGALPVTSKEDLQLHNDAFLSISEEDIIDFVTTSGTLGSPVNFALNEADLKRLAENEFKAFKIAGLKKSDKVQITTTLDRRFMAGLAYFMGLRKLGSGVIRTGSGSPQLQWDSIERFKPSYLIGVPSFLLKMIEYARDNDINLNNSSVKGAICIGEPLRNEKFELNGLGSKINEDWKIELFSTYASTEMSTAFTECPEHRGNHVLSDLIYTEVLDEEGNHVKPGQIGELVITPLQTQTMPLLRYATGDMLTYYEESCTCGRNTPRLSPVIGRKQQKIKLKGTSLYPNHIAEVLNSFGGLKTFIIEASLDELGNDSVKIIIPEDISLPELNNLKNYLKSMLHVTPLLEMEKIRKIDQLRNPKSSRKPINFRDLR
ncbi:phenylacetate--CoA ligase family protein [Christiangramia salexigens]|uniref:Phenylacetate--CoA ligase n=1 Tax=Christiangramia salexigens TaxID=1913577 RepID=A0A1L3J321_9FLAO|nr:AMP-binding protein [Christiangramia salexigens]APG59516.1 phenylacetate--CoA ligase [Christiangramia salexigens]